MSHASPRIRIPDDTISYRLNNVYIIVWIRSNLCRNPLAQLEEEKREHDNKMKKMETEMEQVFEMKVREKKQKLKDSEADVSVKSWWRYVIS